MAYYDNKFLEKYYKTRTGKQLFEEYSLHIEIYNSSHVSDSIILDYLDDIHKLLVAECADRYLDMFLRSENEIII